MARDVTKRGGGLAGNPVLPQPKKKLIGEMLVDEGLVTAGHLAEALSLQKTQGGKLAENLIKLGHLDLTQFARFMSRQKGIPSIQLSNYQVAPEICKLVPKAFAVKHEVFPIDQLGKLLTVGMCFPLDTGTIEELEEITGLTVKALLCSHQDLHNAIKHYYPEDRDEAIDELRLGSEEEIKSAVKLGSVAKMVRQLDTLPTLPQTVQKVQEANDNEMISLKEVAEIIEMDPPIAARLLRLANSAAYGFPHSIDSVEMATALLGLKETYMVVLSSAVIDVTSKSTGFDYDQFWKHSMFCATAAKGIARLCGHEKNPAVFTGGLLHEIGRFALLEVVPGRYGKIDASLKGEALIEAEEHELGIAHPEAGYLLADHWGLPGEITEAIRFHHAPGLASKAKDTVTMVAAAAALAEANTSELVDETSLFEQCGDTMRPLKLTSEQVYAIYQEARATAGAH